MSDHSPTICHGRAGRATIVLAFAVAMVATAPAHADYGPGSEVASANGTRLGDEPSTVPSISDDGRFVVFATRSSRLLGSPPEAGERYESGFVRRDMVTGTVELVAPPRSVRRTDGTVLAPGPTGEPSISGNGRYVLFATSAQLAVGDENANQDVYVRDMSRPVSDAGAYELVSALDGTDEAPEYSATADAAGSVGGGRGFALSDDGRRAVFSTVVGANLPNGSAVAPRAQVFVRQLDTRRTLLVTRDRSDAGLPGTPVAPVVSGAVEPSPNPVISGNGSAVAWVDTNPSRQTRTLAGEPSVASLLWRDVDAGPGAPTRRVAGASDPDDPACPPDAPYPSGSATATGPCFGPFLVSEAQATSTSNLEAFPSISDDGRRVLFMSSSQQRPLDSRTESPNIIYLADMSPGLSRKQGVRRILRGFGQLTPNEATLAGSGTRLAFTSSGVVFEGPRVIGTFPSGTPATRNAFVIDLSLGIVQRATVGSDGADYRGAAAPPPADVNTFVDPAPASLALSDDAGAVAFAATDANLFVGDANAVQDVQVVRGTPGVAIPRSVFAAAPAAPPARNETGEASRPLRPPLPVNPVIGYPTVDRLGVARLTVRVPVAGRVDATATGTPRGRRTRIASTRRRPRSASTVLLRLAPTRAARRAMRRSKRVKVRLTVQYKPKAGARTTVRRSYTISRRTPIARRPAR